VFSWKITLLCRESRGACRQGKLIGCNPPFLKLTLLGDSLETEVRRVGSWCEMVARPGTIDRPLFEDVTKQGNEDRD
jgi:hypothetical protein